MTTHPENAHSSDQQASGHCGHGCAAHAPEAVRKAAASANGAECDRESLRPREIIHHFPLIDELLEAVYRDTAERMERKRELIPAGIDYLGVAGSLERIGDYVTNICERVVFLNTGEIVELN